MNKRALALLACVLTVVLLSCAVPVTPAAMDAPAATSSPALSPAPTPTLSPTPTPTLSPTPEPLVLEFAPGQVIYDQGGCTLTFTKVRYTTGVSVEAEILDSRAVKPVNYFLPDFFGFTVNGWHFPRGEATTKETDSGTIITLTYPLDSAMSAILDITQIQSASLALDVPFLEDLGSESVTTQIAGFVSQPAINPACSPDYVQRYDDSGTALFSSGSLRAVYKAVDEDRQLLYVYLENASASAFLESGYWNPPALIAFYPFINGQAEALDPDENYGPNSDFLSCYFPAGGRALLRLDLSDALEQQQVLRPQRVTVAYSYHCMDGMSYTNYRYFEAWPTENAAPPAPALEPAGDVWAENPAAKLVYLGISEAPRRPAFLLINKSATDTLHVAPFPDSFVNEDYLDYWYSPIPPQCALTSYAGYYNVVERYFTTSPSTYGYPSPPLETLSVQLDIRNAATDQTVLLASGVVRLEE